ncbi:hypothetical protein B0H17DRAFT_1148749 [Mycena rosella]|uniref:F-box domain-containing protein n=1 Tax=Mycena rosella TaxID=1033263 RepID=A0AAD7C9K5_MYCRO|nr:hypothetical protein B0H17DRAFT_1148749 [Mycena rosella]
MLQLPVELVICILKYLPLSTLSQLLSTSREWNNFFESNQSILYHNAAVLHGFTPSASIVYSDLEAIQDDRDMTPHRAALSRRSLTGVSDWKSFCYKQIRIRSAWRAETSSCVVAHRSTEIDGSNVHRIKADEQRGFVIVTHSIGGLLVADLDEDELLWSLPRTYVHEYAHCEYDSGYLIFDRLSGEKEVWRVVDDAGMTPDAPTFSFPDEKQNSISSSAHDFPLHSRGHFKPWMVLKPPALTRAFRFVFPTLIAATEISPDGVGSSTSLGAHINYVEGSYGNNTYSFLADDSHKEDWLPNSVLKPQPLNRHVVLPDSSDRRLIDEFIAALLADSRLVVIPFFERIINGEANIREISLDIQLGSPCSVSRYLAFENGRVAVATGTGLFIVNFDFESARDSLDPPPVSVHRAAWFNGPVGLKSITCLQMSATCIFLNWEANLG